MAQGGAQAQQQPTNLNNGVTNGAPAHAEHGRKPSVVINASGAYGTTSNGGPVAPNVMRAGINFGSTNQQGSDAPATQSFQQQHSSLPAPRSDPRVTSPAHSPSPIPQPQASGGRPPSLQQSSNMPNFGQLPVDGDLSRGGPGTPGQLHQIPMHERRASSHSMQSELSNQGVSPNFNRSGNMMPGGVGRGRNFAPQQNFIPSPGPQYRNIAGQPPRNNLPHYQQQAPGSPFARNRASPVPMPAQPQMQPQMGGNPQMGYGGFPQHLGPQHQGMYGMPGYDPNTGYYQPYMYGQFQGPPQSPRPQQYQNPYPAPGGMPPYGPMSTPGMARSSSQASDPRPSSSLGHSQTPVSSGPTSTQAPTPQSANFVRPVKANKAIVIRDANGNPIDFTKKQSTPAATAPSTSSTPVIVSTPSAVVPPPRTPSSQGKPALTSEETKASFAEQVKRKKEEDDAKAKQESEAVKGAGSETSAAPAADVVKEAVAGAEKAAAVAAGDDKAAGEAEAAANAVKKDAGETTEKEETEEERMEREIAEMEAAEREEEEREKAFMEKKKKEKEEAAKIAAAKLDEDLKRQEREAEEREAQRGREREGESKGDADEESKALFASLKRPTFGPGANASESGAQTPASEDTPSESGNEPPAPATTGRAAGAQKPKPIPHPLKLDTSKQVERAEPTPGMQALKSARFLTVKDTPSYPDGFQSPNPALNPAGQRKGRAYDKNFLLQFQQVFKEKPSVDWDQRVRETLGSDEPGSARPGASRTPSTAGPRGTVGRAPASVSNFGGTMGNFGGQARGTTSQDRFNASTMGITPRPGMPGIARVPSQLGMGPGASMSRQNSVQMMGNMGMAGSPRQVSSRGGRDRSKREDRSKSKKEEAEMAAKMPLTAHMEIAPLQASTSGWKATSIGAAPTASGPDPSGLMAPDLVQRKVKAALNKMTPEKFDKISDQILEIAAQSKNESDGRTLRQVIQLTFEKACDEAHWAGMYAQFCHKMLTAMSQEIRDETIKDKNGNPVVGGALFRKYLLNRCQEEFERGWQADLPDKPEGEEEAALLSEEYYIAAAAKRRGLGLIQFIGQLYRLRMLTLRIMHECVVRLLNFKGEPDEASIENLTTLLKVIGATMEEDEQGRNSINMYFQRIEEVILKSPSLPSRPKFMVMDLIDLRKAGWKDKNASKGPKTIQQIHEEAEAAKAKEEAERARQSQRGGAPGGRMPPGRGDARNFSGNMPPPQDFQRTNVTTEDLRRLANRSNRPQSGSLGPGGGLASLAPRNNSRRGLGPGSGNTTRTSTPPVDGKKEEPMQQNAFSALAALDPSGEAAEPANDAVSPPPSRDTTNEEESSTNA